jgi:hypothetical protein
VAGPNGIPQRLGHAGYFDLGQMATDFVTLGLLDRPWYDKEPNPAGVVLGYYRADTFDAESWEPGYPNPAFDAATEADNAWMARIIARLTPDHIRALVDRAHLKNEVMAREIVRVMIARRQKMLERYLTRLSPLAWPEIRDGRVCLQDLAVWTRTRDLATRRWRAEAHLEGAGSRSVNVRPADGAWVCVEVPRVPDAGSDAPKYLVIDVVASSVGRETTGPARLHFWDDGRGTPMLVGLERPHDAKGPQL